MMRAVFNRTRFEDAGHFRRTFRSRRGHVEAAVVWGHPTERRIPTDPLEAVELRQEGPDAASVVQETNGAACPLLFSQVSFLRGEERVGPRAVSLLVSGYGGGSECRPPAAEL